jgi:hypothetical protein
MGRDSITGPALTNLDFSALKDFRVTENRRLQLRVESFNISNHPNWLMTTGSSWGNSSATPAATFNKITSTINGNNSMRQIQFALKYIF